MSDMATAACNTAEKIITAKLHETDFDVSDSNFNSLTAIGDEVFYTLSSHNLDTHGRVYGYDIKTGDIRMLADLGEITGETGKKSIPQGKSHARFYRIGDKVYFSTHVAYSVRGDDAREAPGVPDGYKPYPGGKLVEYCLKTGAAKILYTAPEGEGFMTFHVDTGRSLAYLLTWPSAHFYVYDIKNGLAFDRGCNSRGGEGGRGDQFMCICRCIVTDPRDGAAYYTNADGEILEYRHETGVVKAVGWAHLRKDVFGRLDPHRGGHYGYNWRWILWNEKYQKFYAVHGKSGYLFTFDPKARKVEVITRIASEYCIKNGIYEYFRYGYMTLDLKPGDDDLLYYISGYCVFKDPTPELARLAQQTGDPDETKEGLKTEQFITLVTYHIPTGAYKDHGVIRLEDGKYPSNTQSIAIDRYGRIYTCPWIPRGDGARTRCQLISFTCPE